FTAIVMSGKRLEWVVNYQDDKNYDLFQMDNKNLVRTQFVNGKGVASAKSPHSIKININKDYVIVRVTVTPSSVVYSFYVQGQWQDVDKWERPGGGLEGKFGFHVPGNDR